MTAGEERDLMARQRDWLLARLDFHQVCVCSLCRAIAQAFTHDPADQEAPDGS
jgi:hypothetical protein